MFKSCQFIDIDAEPSAGERAADGRRINEESTPRSRLVQAV
jgi:hypothetical protein